MEQQCTKCGELKYLKDFPTYKSGGNSYRRSWCRKCENKRTNSYNKSSIRRNRLKYAEKLKEKRRLNIETERWILVDSKQADKKHQRENDLTKEFIKDLIQRGCSYCGENKIRMTLDRIDNKIGHIKSNVVPSCIRCNFIRKDMPYEAWIQLSDILKKVKELGLFGNWTGRVK